MENSPLIEITNLSKKYRLYNNNIDRLKEAINPFRKKYHQDFYALKDINLKISGNEIIGVIGKNGSGKSTLLKLICGILNPTEGNLRVNGKLSSILDLGTGFNMDLNGIDNILFISYLMGYSKDEIKGKIELIKKFADIGDFIYQPVKSYSSGMFIRLAFAISINIDPDILIIDEALSVGDIQFQQKCFRRLKEFMNKNKIIIFVSHDISSILNFCTRVVWINKGIIYKTGEPKDICKQYVSYMVYDKMTEVNNKNEIHRKVTSNEKKIDSEIEWEQVRGLENFGNKKAEITGVSLYSKNENKKIKMTQSGEEVVLFMKAEIYDYVLSPGYGFIMSDKLGNNIIGVNNYIYGTIMDPIEAGEKLLVRFSFSIPEIKNGVYTFTVAISDGYQENHEQLHWIHDAYILEIYNSDIKYKLGNYLVLKDNVDISVDRF